MSPQRALVILLLVLGGLIRCAAGVVVLQMQHVVTDQEEQPPPLKTIPPTLLAQLTEARSDKARTRLSITFAEESLNQVHELMVAKSYEEASAQLGIYEALVEDALRHLEQTRRRDDKTRDLFKKLEQTLREQAPRIEAIRRITPHEFTANVRRAYEMVRHARTQALEAFYGNTVLRGGSEHSLPRDKTSQTTSTP